MKNELETNFGRTLQVLVTVLLKNAQKIPEPVLQGALDFESFKWDNQDDATKRSRLRAIAELTEAPSPVNRFLETYPHAFSRQRYQDYLVALKFYKEFLSV
jgi:hypothetical protein